MTATCKHCGKPESEHHEFEPFMPPGCVCRLKNRSDFPLDACDKFMEDLSWYGAECKQCKHARECHKEAKP